MSDKIKLKPCPFCLNKHPQVNSNGGCNRFNVHCFGCQTTKHPDFNEGDEDTEEGAIKSWNRRIIKEE